MMSNENKNMNELWKRAVEFHGHQCPGLAIGVKACEAVIDKMGLERSEDEELVCITENDACGVDAIQVLLGCTAGKGNLIFKNTGKQAFTFINRNTEKAMRFYLRHDLPKMPRDEKITFLLSSSVDDIFIYEETSASLPEPARHFLDIQCEVCGEVSPEHKIRMQDGKHVCLDCFNDYSRGWF